MAQRGSGFANDKDMRRRIFSRLFRDPILVVELDRALAEWSLADEETLRREGHSDRSELVNEVLRRANGGADPRFDDIQISCLNEVWHSDAYEPIRPTTRADALIVGLRFWRQLMALTPDQVTGFHQSITTWGGRRDPSSWSEVLRYVEKLGLDEELTQEHAEALVYLTRDDARLRSLRWFGSDGDVW
jgi:hypothetical protein